MRVLLYQAGDAESHRKLGKELSLLDSGEYVVTIKKNRAIRSLSQNKYYHAILKIIAIDTGHDHEMLHEICKKKFNGETISFPKGGMEIVGKSTSNLDTAEFTAYINRVKQWAIDEFDMVIPEAKDVDYKKWIDIENEYERSFTG